MNETWRDMVGWENKYLVSDHGNVRSKDVVVPDRRTGTRSLKGRDIKQQTIKRYKYVGLCRNGKVLLKQVHVIVLETFHGPKPSPDYVARHYPDRDPANNKTSNLSWASPKTNSADRKEHGTEVKKFNEDHPGCKLSAEEIRRLRKLAETKNYTQRQLAKMFNVSQSLVSRIVRNLARVMA